jgi:hypothetical protein
MYNAVTWPLTISLNVCCNFFAYGILFESGDTPMMKIVTAVVALLLAAGSAPSIAQTAGGVPPATPGVPALHKSVAIYRVKDFATWYAAYQQYTTQREAMGLKNGRVFRSVTDPNMVAIYSEVDDLNKIATFRTSPATIAEQEKGGVLPPTDIFTK